jgi:hypothetical protein
MSHRLLPHRRSSRLSIIAVSLVATSLLFAGKVNAAPDSEPANVPVVSYTPGPMLQRFLDGPMNGCEEIVFAVRVPGRDHWYVTFGNYASFLPEPADRAFKEEDGVLWGYGEGARLCRLNLRTGKLSILLEDPKGGIRDPQLHYDGHKVLFAYRKGGEHPFHLYEINIDGSDLRQLTDGPDDDIEPTYCPDGSIVFCSSRCRRFVNCWHTRVASLYRCDSDGSNVRMLSSNNDHDNTPWTLPDGRVLYMRWEYVDRSQVHFHHLWTMNPDGTGQMVYYGNQHGGVAMLDAKPIPNSKKVVASFSPGHGRPEHLGFVTVVDPSTGPDDLQAVKRISKDSWWKDPYAYSEECFLVAHKRGLFVMDGEGNHEMIYQLPKEDRFMECHEPRPLRGRPRERIAVPRTDLTAANGRLILKDIYHGRKMSGVEPGTIKKILVLQQVPKPVNFSGGMQPLTIGGSFTLAQILGTVPVEADGSAYMEVPPLRSLFFVALDENDLAVKRMHSFHIVQPGETTSCVGCHEQRSEAPAPMHGTLLAMQREPSIIEPISGVPDVIDFPRDIQPILDKYCVECHNPDKFEAMVDLTGDKTAMYTMSYWTMQSHGLVSDGRNRDHSNYDPYRIGSGASRLMTMIDEGHYGVNVSTHERDMIRLWIDTSATYPGTYASLGCGTYYAPLPYKEMMARCGECHVYDSVDNRNRPRKVVRFARKSSTHAGTSYNLTRPEKSMILLAPLSKDAGGLGLCSKIVFQKKEDPLYQQMLRAVQTGHQALMKGKRFDMPGFRPNEHYIREMQRFGIIPPDLKVTDPIDVYAVDKAYWESFYWQPESWLPEME